MGSGERLLTTDSSIPHALLHQLLYFAAAKSDTQATRLLLLLTRTLPTVLQQHCPRSTKPLRKHLAQLLTPPSAKQQLELLRRLNPSLFHSNVAGIETFLEGSKARFEFRVSDSINDTAMHVSSYLYDHRTLLEMLALGGSGAANVRDSLVCAPTLALLQ